MPNPIYIVDVPDLIEKWDYELNKQVDVNTIRVGDEKKYWWKCKKGHSYPSSPDIQRHGKGCSVCAGKYILRGVNDFETWCKENGKEYLLDEWDYEANSKRPYEYSPRSGQKVNWVCRLCGNKWLATINNRTNNTGCSKCSTARQTSFPEQALAYYLGQYYNNMLLHYRLKNTRLTLDIFLPDTNIGIEYDGYKWHSSIKSIANEEKKNAYCQKNGIRLIRIKESTKRITAHVIEDTLYYYRDKKDKNLNAAIKWLISSILGIENGNRIDVASDRGLIMDGYYSFQGSNTLAAKRPELLNEWDKTANYPMSPYLIPYRSNIEVKWICPKGHHYLMTVDKRSSGRNCTYCYGTSSILEGFNDFKTWCVQNDKEYLISEWDYDKNGDRPEDHKHGEKAKVFWKCPMCGNEWKASLLHRSRGRINCSICNPSRSKKKVYSRSVSTGDISEFSSIVEASNITGISEKRISKARKNREEYGGFVWSDIPL